MLRVDVDAEELTTDDTFQHFTKLRVVVGQLHIRPHLSTRVAQPHGMDVACVDKGVRLSVGLAEVYSGVESVREAVLEHPSQVRILQHRLDFLDFPCCP